MSKTRILVVDDEEGMLEVCVATLGKLPDVEILSETSGHRAAELLGREDVDLMVTDVCMPEVGGVDLLRLARQRDLDMAILMMTAYPTLETAVESMKLGAADYIVKPFVPMDLLNTARQLLESRRLKRDNEVLRRQMERPYASCDILGQSPAMRHFLERMKRFARTGINVVIEGETGTGKELVARAIHHQSERRARPFVPIDCGAIPEELLESELFGHERGAFTGAQARSVGLLEFAHTGTFFLDELGQLPPRLQPKLLRVLQERKIRRVGSTKETEIDVRIIAASSVDLQEEVKRGRFRLDLYHRIHVGHLRLPPLRQRVEDIPVLAEHYLSRYCGEMDRGKVALSRESLEVLTSYPWPGNVRELQNVLKQTLALSRGAVITPDDLPEAVVALAGDGGGSAADGYFSIREQQLLGFERNYLRTLMSKCQGDIPLAIEEARIPRGTLYRLLKKHNLDPADFRKVEPS
jgi:DNA-binding NtrC family response regulator